VGIWYILWAFGIFCQENLATLIKVRGRRGRGGGYAQCFWISGHENCFPRKKGIHPIIPSDDVDHQLEVNAVKLHVAIIGPQLFTFLKPQFALLLKHKRIHHHICTVHDS
jgi:hypothetical protein